MIPTSVSLSVIRTGCVTMAERIDVLLGMESLGDPRNGSPDSPRIRCGLRQITLVSCSTLFSPVNYGIYSRLPWNRSYVKAHASQRNDSVDSFLQTKKFFTQLVTQ